MERLVHRLQKKRYSVVYAREYDVMETHGYVGDQVPPAVLQTNSRLHAWLSAVLRSWRRDMLVIDHHTGRWSRLAHVP